jgi:hypothetical protein
MLKLIFLTIILYILICNFIEDSDIDNKNNKQMNTNLNKSVESVPLPENQNINLMNASVKNKIGVTGVNNPPAILSEAKVKTNINTRETFGDTSEDEDKVMSFDKPNPWTKIIIKKLEEYPYLFHIKVKVPSLNDFENWKQIVPNIDFDPRNGELIIPSKDEPSALALANLIIINFMGQMSLQNILEKNLIQISINKAKSYEVVQNKLREQIIENLYGKTFNSSDSSFEKDLAKKGVENFTPQIEKSERIDFKSTNFVDTFKHFSDDSNVSNKAETDIEAWTGSDYSYI